VAARFILCCIFLRKQITNQIKEKVTMISLPVSIDTEQIKTQRLDLSYPIVRQLHDKNIEQQINYEILMTGQRMLQKQGWYENPLTEITASYEIKTNERGVLSLALINVNQLCLFWWSTWNDD
jgi:hypothetical protein